MQSGKTRGDVLVTITERLSRQHIMRHVSGRNSQAVTPAIIRFFKGIKNAKSITVDHGREFAKYDEIEEQLGIQMYFAHPYSPKIFFISFLPIVRLTVYWLIASVWLAVYEAAPSSREASL